MTSSMPWNRLLLQCGPLPPSATTLSQQVRALSTVPEEISYPVVSLGTDLNCGDLFGLGRVKSYVVSYVPASDPVIGR